MPVECRNIYKIARRAAGFTQEAAAEQLDISVESIRAYEGGLRVPPDEAVLRMVECYRLTPLACQHLQQTNVLMPLVMPLLQERDLLQVCVRIYNLIRRVDTHGELNRLLSIAEDGVIDETERPDYEHILGELGEIVRAGLELSVYCKDT